MNVSTTSALSVAAGSALVNIPEQARVQSLVVLVVLVGLIQLLAGLFRLGTVIRFVSNAVMVGFTTGVSLLIILGQLDDFTGYSSAFSGRVSSALDTLLSIQQWQLPAVAVGGLVLALILLLSRTRYAKAAYVIALLAGTALGVLLNSVNPGAVQDIPPIPDKLFAFVRPDFQYLPVLIPSALGIAIIGLVQGAGVAQNFPNPNGRFGDVSRDFFGQGVANIAAGLFTGIPGGGSMSGTALVVGTGGRTRWANVFAGLLVIPLVWLLSDLFDLIPLPALGGLLIAVGIQSLRPAAIKTVWDTGLPSRVAMGMTLASTLILPLQYAVFVGVAISIMLHTLQSSARVRLVEFLPVEGGFPIERDAPKQLESESVTILMPYGDLFFAAAPILEHLLPEVGRARRMAVILSLHSREEIGSTFIGVLRRYAEALQARDGRLYVTGVGPDLGKQLQRTGLNDLIGPDRIIPATPQLGSAANKALADAYAWLDKPIQYANPTGG
jgi:SulP family sulfate permease